MDHSRLAKRGIFGALVVMEGHLESCQGQLTRTRHLHPWELSVLAGAMPNKQWLPHLRLGICGLGQMASPIQSAWMYGQYQYEVRKQLGFTDLKSPETILWEFVQQIFDSFDRQFPEIFHTPSVAEFVSKTFDLLWAGHMDTVAPSVIANVAESPQAEDASLTHEAHEGIHPDRRLTNLGEEKHEEESPSKIEDDGYADPDWECPYQDCCICDPQLTIALRNLMRLHHHCCTRRIPFLQLSPTRFKQMNRLLILSLSQEVYLLFHRKDRWLKQLNQLGNALKLITTMDII